MNNIIEKVLEEHAEMQINLGSEAARKLLAGSIASALMGEIKIREKAVANEDEGRTRFLRPRKSNVNHDSN